MKLQGFAWRQKERPLDFKGLRTWYSAPLVRVSDNASRTDTFSNAVLDILNKEEKGSKERPDKPKDKKKGK